MNYHRPCLFAQVETDAEGEKRKVDRTTDIRTPCEVLQALTEAERYLRPGETFAELHASASAAPPRWSRRTQRLDLPPSLPGTSPSGHGDGHFPFAEKADI